MDLLLAVQQNAKPDTRDALVPRPKRLQREVGKFLLRPATCVICAGDDAVEREALHFIEELREVHGLELQLGAAGSRRGKSCIEFRQTTKGFSAEAPDGVDESYSLEITPDCVSLRGTTPAGLYYAALTLRLLIRPRGRGWFIPCCRITDWPDFRWRGLLIAPGQGFMPWSELRQTIDRMAHSKLNVLHLHLTDNVLFTPQIKTYPELRNGVGTDPQSARKTYRARDLKRIVDYAGARHIEVMPEIEFPGHAMTVLKQFPHLRCKPKTGEISHSTMCLGAEATYEFIGRIVTELAPLFPSRYFHIGTDEVEFLDIPEAKVFFNWNECSVCRERMRREKISDVRGLFYYFVRRTREILHAHGKTTVMWNDQIDSAHPRQVEVPRDVVMQFWRIAAPGRGPWKNCTYEKLMKLGFPIINSFFPETYIDLYIQEERLANWTPLTVPPLPPDRPRQQVMGSTLCAWEHLDIYPRVLPSAIPFFADRTWNSTSISDLKEFGRCLARHLFGPQAPPKLMVMFEMLGGSILPLNQDKSQRARLERSLPGQTDAQRLVAYDDMLHTIDDALASGVVRDTAALQEYRRCIEWLREEVKRRMLGIGSV